MAGFDVNTAYSVKDKVVIVTGGGTGIGKVYSQRLAEGGAKVVLADIAGEAGEAVAAGIREKGGEAIAIRTDVIAPTPCRRWSIRRSPNGAASTGSSTTLR